VLCGKTERLHNFWNCFAAILLSLIDALATTIRSIIVNDKLMHCGRDNIICQPVTSRLAGLYVKPTPREKPNA